jgi:hypothetical protein
MAIYDMSDNKTEHNKYSRTAVFAIVLTFVLGATLAPRLTAGSDYGPSPSPNPIQMSPSFPQIQTVPTPPIVVPTDVESTLNSFPGNVPTPGVFIDYGSIALNGIMRLPDSAFPPDSALSGPTTGITVKFAQGSEYKMESDYIVVLKKGEILVSVKKPSKLALIKTPFGSISVAADGDVLCKFDNGTLRVTNLDGAGQCIKAQLNQGPFAGASDPTVTIAAGFEMVGSEHRLTRADMRPRDGVARRHFKVLENGHLAISEISVESVMKANDVIADLRQSSTGVKERRILGDMSKMAAVLNFKNGTQGFKVEE